MFYFRWSLISRAKADWHNDVALFGDRRFLRLFLARFVSVLGDGFGNIALTFAVLALPGATPGRLSLVLACQFTPQLIFLLVGGVVGDRFPRYRVIMGAELLGGLAWAGLAVMFLTGVAPIALVALLAAVGGSASALFLPAYTGVVPEIVGPERRQTANALLRLGYNLGLTLGLALAGVCIAVFGASWAVAINALSFGMSALLVAGLKLPNSVQRLPRHPLVELREGWHEFTARQWVWVIAIQHAFVIAALNAEVGILGPLVATNRLGGAPAWSAIIAANALGTIVGVIVAIRLRPRKPILVATLLTFVAALPMALLGGGASIASIMAGMFTAGIAKAIFNVLWITAMQRTIPSEAVARVISWDLLPAYALVPLGLLAAGSAAARWGASTVLIGCSGLVIVVTGLALMSPSIRAFVNND